MKTPTIIWEKQKKWNGMFAWFDGFKTVIVYKYRWVPRFLYERFVIPHEIGHFNGIPASGCIGKHRWCVMAEESQVGEQDATFKGKLKLLPFQLFYGWGRYCKFCRAVIKIKEIKKNENADT